MGGREKEGSEVRGLETGERGGRGRGREEKMINTPNTKTKCISSSSSSCDCMSCDIL